MSSFFRPIDVRVWGRKKFRELSSASPNGQTLWIYLLTGPHTTMLPGLWSVGAAQIGESLGWQAGDVCTVFRELSDRGMAKADWPARVVLIPNTVRYWKPGPRNIQGYTRLFQSVPDSSLKDEWLCIVKGWCEAQDDGGDRLEAFERSFVSPSPSPLVSPLASGMVAPLGVPPVPVPVPVPDPDRQQEAKRLAQVLASSIQKYIPTAKIPASFTAWESVIDRMIRLDKRSPNDIERVIEWATADEFWQSNILSARSLRKHFDRLNLQSKRKPHGKQFVPTDEEETRRKIAQKKRAIEMWLKEGDLTQAQAQAAQPGHVGEVLMDFLKRKLEGRTR